MAFATKFKGIILLTFLGLVLASASQASVSDMIVATGSPSQYFGNMGGDAYGQSFVPTQNNIYGIRINSWVYQAPYEPPQLALYVCRGTPDLYTYDTTGGCANASSSLAGMKIVDDLSSWITGNNGEYYQDIIFNSPIYVYSGENYYFTIYTTGASSTGVNTFYRVSNPYAGGQMLWQYGNYPQYAQATTTIDTYDLSFRIWYDTSYTPFSLTPVFPTNTQQVRDFVAWNLSYNYVTSEPFIVGVKYGTTTSLLYDDWVTKTASVGSTEIAITKTHDLPVGDYFFKLYLFAGTDYIASTSMMMFSVTSTGTLQTSGYWSQVNDSVLNIGHQSDEILCGDLATSTILGDLECIFRRVLDWTITPSQRTYQGFQARASTTMTRFPFSVVSSFTNVLSNAIASTTNATNTQFQMPVPVAGSSTQIQFVNSVSSSTMALVIGEENNNFLRDLFTWLVWGWFAFFVVTTIFPNLGSVFGLLWGGNEEMSENDRDRRDWENEKAEQLHAQRRAERFKRWNNI